MDNLIRAHDGQAFVQLAYRDLIVQDLDSLQGSADYTVAGTDIRERGALGVITKLSHTMANTLKMSASTKRDKTLSFHADPITNQNDVYELYLAFAKDPSLFIVSPEPPPECAAHIVRKCGDRYYWVPSDAADVFQRMVLKTTFLRGPESAPPVEYYEVRIDDVQQLVDENGAVIPDLDEGEIRRVLVFDKLIPNGDGRLVVSLKGGRRVTLMVEQVAEFPRTLTQPNPATTTGPPPGQPIDRLYVSWVPKSKLLLAEDLRTSTAKFYSDEFPAPAPKPAADLQRLNDSLDQIRLNLQNNR